MKSIFFLSLCCCQFFFANGEEDSGLFLESPQTIEILAQSEMINARWESFLQEIQWFMDYSSPDKMIEQIVDENDGSEEQRDYIKKKWQREYNTLVDNLSQAQEAFLTFREQVASLISSRYGDGQCAPVGYIASSVQLTIRYIEYIENNLFPPNWKDLYHERITQSSDLPCSKKNKSGLAFVG